MLTDVVFWQVKTFTNMTCGVHPTTPFPAIVTKHCQVFERLLF